MLKIKLARYGKRSQPHYRIVVNEARDKRDGSYVESLGHYAPTQTPKILEVDVKKFDEWVKKGAQPTETVQGLVNRFKSGIPFPEKKARLSKKSKAKAEAAEAAKAEAAQEAAAPKEAAPAVAEAEEAKDEKEVAAEAEEKTEEKAA